MILKAQTKWRWIIAGYLFLAGLGAGAYVTGVVADFIGGDQWMQIAKIGAALGFPCVAVGCGLLILDLGKPINFFRAFARPNCSWMARGSIIILIFMIIGAIHIAFWLWPFGGLENAAAARHTLGVLGMIFGFATMVYTGILLAASRPIAFWSTAILPQLFLVSALSTGIMAVTMIALLQGAAHDGPVMWLSRIDMVLILLEMFVLGIFFQATHRVPESRASAKRVLAGQVAPLFWLGVAVLGLIVPFVLEYVGVYQAHGGGAAAMGIVASICGIVGGLILRQVILLGGIHAPLKAGRFEYGLPIV